MTDLAGKTVVLTRPVEQSTELADLLAEVDVNVLLVPLIKIVGPSDGGRKLKAALERADDYDWIVVTSANGAQSIAAFMQSLVASGARRPKIAAVGAATAQALGCAADFMPSVANAQTLVREFPYGEGRVLLAQVENLGGAVDSSVARGLGERGWLVDEAAAYQTVAATPSEDEVAQAAQADAVVFYSGSAVRSWRAGVGMKTPDVVIAIGESTARVARNLNIRVSSVAAQTTPSAVVAALVEVFEQLRP